MGGTGQAEEANLGLASLNNFSGLWNLAAVIVVWYLVLRWLGQGGSDPECKGLVEEGVGWVGLHMRGKLKGPETDSPRGAILSRFIQAPRCQNIRKHTHTHTHPDY